MLENLGRITRRVGELGTERELQKKMGPLKKPIQVAEVQDGLSLLHVIKCPYVDMYIPPDAVVAVSRAAWLLGAMP